MILLSKFSLCNVLIFKGCFTFVVALWHFSNYLVLTCLRVQKERKKVPHTQIFFYGNKFCVTHTHSTYSPYSCYTHLWLQTLYTTVPNLYKLHVDKTKNLCANPSGELGELVHSRGILINGNRTSKIQAQIFRELKSSHTSPDCPKYMFTEV